MDEPSFAALLGRVHAASFSSDRIGVVQMAAPHSLFTADQARRLVAAMTFSSERTQVVDLVVPRLVDPENGWMIADAMTFASERFHVQRVLASAAPPRW